MSDLRTGLVEAIVKRIEEAAIAMERGHISLLPKLGFAVTDVNGIQRLSIPDAARLAVDGMLGFLTDNADFQNLVWPRDKELPKNPEEWPLVPKLELLAAYGDGMDDRDGKYDESERTVQNDVRRAARIIETIAALSDGRDTGEK